MIKEIPYDSPGKLIEEEAEKAKKNKEKYMKVQTILAVNENDSVGQSN